MNKRFLVRSGGSILAALAIAGCTGGEPATDARSQAADPAPPVASTPDLVRPSEGAARYLETGQPDERVVREMLRIPGRIEANEDRTARIGAPITGRVTAIHAVVGQQVRKGDLLAEISSPELSTAQLAFLKAHSAENLAQRAAERARLLLDAGVIGSAELQRRESELAISRAETRAARDQLRTLGLSAGAIDRLQGTGQILAAAPITATKSGTVIARRAALGQVAEPADELFTITDLRALWAVADVPEKDVRYVGLGQRVVLEVPALGEREIEGDVSHVADLVDPQTRTVRVRMELANPSGEFKPAMLASMRLAGEARRQVVVPKAALVRDGNRDHVFVADEAGAFRLRSVTIGPEDGDNRVVLDGLKAGETIAIAGAFHLNNERRQLANGGR
ncbi:efflux RND transporter periplasmic adaptor subunit [Burkholderiaceae bacterium FT117]|uniref:efflux RND transporter periplasmic adaptor subunit n=1 Tax=Zeimonas sediminis TaxID=2944268 RepID=UPI002342E06D|nr:efflux RND transporter periplasmic adaptor subunit [Zeimonas sediminis]MCM5571656.1 efflux RND transporter periplasmic adaptor subunit [Zeimonas sediminis]